jgi:hypothetical protein
MLSRISHAEASLKEKPIAEAAPGGAPPPEPSPVEEAVQAQHGGASFTQNWTDCLNHKS